MRRPIGLSLVFITAILWAFASFSAGPDELLAQLTPRGHVNDYAGLFGTNELQRTETFLADAEKATGAEIVIVAIPAPQGGDLHACATRLFEKWGLGKKGKDNGALLITAVEDHKVRIEVGYGLEGILPDAKTGRILDEQVLPRFKENRYADGLMSGALALAEIIAQDAGVSLTNGLPAAAQTTSQAAQPMTTGGLIFIIIFLALFVWIMVMAIRKGKTSGPGSSSGSGSTPRSGGSSGSSSSSSSHSFGGGSSGGGGASRSW
ncbi:MAG: TPM domain-containing protein [Lentisphaerota bacterium]